MATKVYYNGKYDDVQKIEYPRIRAGNSPGCTIILKIPFRLDAPSFSGKEQMEPVTWQTERAVTRRTCGPSTCGIKSAPQLSEWQDDCQDRYFTENTNEWERYLLHTPHCTSLRTRIHLTMKTRDALQTTLWMKMKGRHATEGRSHGFTHLAHRRGEFYLLWPRWWIPGLRNEFPVFLPILVHFLRIALKVSP